MDILKGCQNIKSKSIIMLLAGVERQFLQPLNHYIKPSACVMRCQHLYMYLLNQILTDIYSVIFRLRGAAAQPSGKGSSAPGYCSTVSTMRIDLEHYCTTVSSTK